MSIPRFFTALVALLMLTAVAWLALTPALAPPAADTAPATSFSAARAMRHVAVLAQVPRPLGSDANAQARSYLVAQLRALGLEVQVQSATVQHQGPARAANLQATLTVVHNVVVRKQGTRPGLPALLLAAHYDSLVTSPGAASSAALVETLRAILAAPPLAQDLVVLFADAQQQHGMGAQAFVEQHPWAKQVGMVLKFDNAGSRGPMVLYGSSGADGAAIDAWAAHAPRASGSSLLRAVYPLMPHAVPLGPLTTLGVPLLQFANVEGYSESRGSGDTLEQPDATTLQHEGDTMLALARHFANAGLAQGAAGQIYFTLPHAGVVHYAGSLAWPLTRLTCLLLFGVACLVIQRSGMDTIALRKGVCGAALIGAVMAAAAFVMWQMLPTDNGYQPLRQGIDRRNGWYQLACAAFCTIIFIAMQLRLQRQIGSTAAALGALICMALALLALSMWLPSASYALVWPMAALLGALGTLYWRPMQAGAVWILLAGAAPAVFLLTPAIREAFCVLSVSRMHVPLLLAVPLGGGVMLLAALRGTHAGLCIATCLAVAAPCCSAKVSPTIRRTYPINLP